MDVVLQRNEFRSDGIFGQLITEDFKFLFITLEHGYLNKIGVIVSKIPHGIYTCVRGAHKLENHGPDKDVKPFIDIETFEIMGIPKFMGKPVDNCLFHSANYAEEINGCVALGSGYGRRSDGGKMITSSRRAMREFMELQKDLNEFKLTVGGAKPTRTKFT